MKHTEAEHQQLSRKTHKFLLSSYLDLRNLADVILKGERYANTLQPTALVHEAAVRLLKRMQHAFNSEKHFFRTMVHEMRRVLVDHARRRVTRQKHLRERQAEHDDVTDGTYDPIEMIMLDEALDDLAHLDKAKARIAELRIIGGLNNSEIADVLAMPLRTVERKWAVARCRLSLYLEQVHDV